MTKQEIETWRDDRARVAAQHPLAPLHHKRGAPWSRGDHYRRRNTGIALRTYRMITGRK